MSSSRSNNRASSSARSRHSERVVAQTPVDARLHAEFEGSQRHFDYSSSVNRSGASTSSAVSAYLQNMQRGRYIQPFGCLLAIHPDTFALLAYSENAAEMLDLTPHAVPTIDQRDALVLGVDVRTLFRSQSAVALHKAAIFGEVNLLNPILVHARTSGKPFYAILHRIDVTAAGALKSYKLAAKAISRLQSLPSGNLSLLCDVLVREVSELTGYDRVMAYKFHECRRSDLEPYLGLHYPATDIPQASRFLFMKNKVRMICDCAATPVKLIQDDNLSQPPASLTCARGLLRSPASGDAERCMQSQEEQNSWLAYRSTCLQ